MYKVYISGPIAHYELEERKEVFKCAANLLKSMGYEPVNPFENGLDQDDDWHDHMKADIAMLCNCDGIFMLPKWFESKGCKLEFDVATSCGLTIMNKVIAAKLI